MDKFINRTQMQTILDGRPKGVSMDAVINSYRSNGYKVEGIDEAPAQTAPEPTLGSKLMERGKTIVKEATGQPASDILKNADTTSAKDVVGTGSEALLRTAQAPIRALGAVGGAIGDVVGAGIHATGLDKTIGEVVQPVVDSHPVQKAMEVFKTLPQDTQDVLGAILNTANIPLAEGGASIIKNGLESGVKELGQGVKDVSTNISNKVVPVIKPTPTTAIQKTYDGIMNLVENKSSLLKDFSKREGTGKDPIKMIAENPDYNIKVNPESKSIDAGDAMSNMKRDISTFSQVRDELLRTADKHLPPIKTDNVINKALDVFSNKNYSTYLDDGERAVKTIVNKLKTLKKYNPDNVSRERLNEIRQGLDDTINKFTDTKLQDKVRLDLRKVFKTTLEDSIPDSNLLKNLNAKIGDIIDAHSFLDKKLHGSKVKGGGLTDLAMKTAGASTGAIIGGGALGGIPGAAAGYLVSNFLSKNLIKNAINNPFDRKVLETLRQAKPDVVKNAEDYINRMKPKQVTE